MVRAHEATRPAHARSEVLQSTPAAPTASLQALVGNQAVLRRAAVQRDGEGAPAPATVHRLARAGTRGRSQSLPHLAEIQRSFGAHDVTGVAAHTDDIAARAATGMRARAFTFGEHVGFAGAPTLHTAAHEAAHVVQQRRGVDLPGGVGRRGDAFERHAEQVADLVVRGASAEAALGAPVAPATTGGAVQRFESEQAMIDAGKALRAPDTLKEDTELTITGENLADASNKNFARADGTMTLTKGTRLRIMSEKNGLTTIRTFKWSQDRGGWDQFEGTIPTNAVAYGTDEQAEIGLDQVIVPESDDDIHQEDVFQAGLSDCYFQAALASLAAARPAAIRQMIRDEGGEIVVTLYDGPAYAPVAHDIRLKPSLFLDADGKPIYHGKKGTALWPAFVSKAWAVFKGGWANIQMGLAGDAMFALTGHQSSSTALKQLDTNLVGKVKEPSLAFGTYNRIRNNIAADKAVVLGTGSFSKAWFKALNNAFKPKGTWDNRSQPVGAVRNLHCYAVMDISPANLAADDFESSFPDVTVTLRDPRNELGGTFTRTLKDIVTAGKFGTFSYED